jgi:lysophospholipase L1-like esterase
MLFGDSIVEALGMPTVCGLPTLNAAIGGVGVTSVARYVRELVPLAKPTVVVVGVGVNDAWRAVTKPREPSPTEWIQSYKAIIRDVHDVQAILVVLSLLPVEKASPLALQFDSERMARMNQELRRLSDHVGAVYVDTFSVFADASGFMRPGGTVDGVHPTSESYARLADELRQGVAEAMQRKRQPCPAHGR